MIEELTNITKKIGNSIVSETHVKDELGKDSFVVVRFDPLLYATFKESLIDYMKGKSKKEPEMIEGDDFFWLDSTEKRTPYYDIYLKNLEYANSLEHTLYVNSKYRRMKKPLGLNYEIVSKDYKDAYGCAGEPLGYEYEIKFHMLDDNSIYYVYATDVLVNYYCLSDKSQFDTENPCYIEAYESFDLCKKSKYYDLFLEMEKYKDNL